MTPLHAPAALRAAADLDVEAAHDGADRGEFFLILRGDAGHLDGAAAVGARARRRCPVGLVDLRRAASGPLPAVLRPGPSAGRLAGPLRPVLGEGRGLPLAGAAGLIELFPEVFAASLPPVSLAGGAVQVAGGAVQIVDQLGSSPAEAPRSACPANPALAGAPPNRRVRRARWPCPRVSAPAPRRCIPLHGFSRLYPLTKDDFAAIRSASRLVRPIRRTGAGLRIAGWERGRGGLAEHSSNRPGNRE